MTLVVDGVELKVVDRSVLDMSVVDWNRHDDVNDVVRCLKALDWLPREFEWRPAPVPDGYAEIFEIRGRTILLSGRTNRGDSLSED